MLNDKFDASSTKKKILNLKSSFSVLTVDASEPSVHDLQMFRAKNKYPPYIAYVTCIRIILF